MGWQGLASGAVEKNKSHLSTINTARLTNLQIDLTDLQTDCVMCYLYVCMYMCVYCPGCLEE